VDIISTIIINLILGAYTVCSATDRQNTNRTMQSITTTITKATIPAATAIPTVIPIERSSSFLSGIGEVVGDGIVVIGGVVNNLVGVVMACTTNKITLQVSSSYYPINPYNHSLIQS